MQAECVDWKYHLFSPPSEKKWSATILNDSSPYCERYETMPNSGASVWMLLIWPEYLPFFTNINSTHVVFVCLQAMCIPCCVCVSAGYVYPKSCTLRCPSLYAIMGGSTIITCQASGVWTDHSSAYCGLTNRAPTKVMGE